jgi:hypothetical protein
MQTINVTLLLSVLLLFSSCKKESSAAGTQYSFLSPYSDAGKPNNLQKDSISPGLTASVDATLTEFQDLRTKHPDFFNEPNKDFALTERSEISVTFVAQSTGSGDAIGFYTYPTNTPPSSIQDIQKITYIFPNAGFGTPLKSGDKVSLGQFNAGTSIGLVLLQNAWDGARKLVNSKAVHFYYNDSLNPESDPKLKKHAVIFGYPAENKSLIGFEDSDRSNPGCDHDFYDVVLYATVKKI